MRATLERAHLLKPLSHVQRVVERRNTIPILSNVLIRADGASLTLKATDLDLELIETVEAGVEQPGAITVPAHMLHDIVRKIPEGARIALETNPDGSTMTLTAGRSRFALQMLPESDYPDITGGEFTHAFKLKAADFKWLIDRTQFAISTEETRYYLNGIYFHAVDAPGGAMFRAVATDGHRLAQAQVEAPEGAAGMPGIIVPRKTVGELQRLMENPEAELTIELSDTKIRVTFANVVLTSKLIDGTFPDYDRVIPKNNTKIMHVDRIDFAAAVDRVSTVSSERGRAVKLSLTDGSLTLSVINPDSGTATDELVVDFDSEPLDIGFNSKYLLDITSQLGSENATFALADPGSPTLIHDGDAEKTLYVLMPMRV
ncbi:DNA polymerase III subunit beta [Acuticoccus sp. I52.16.1]|uniref:DNA polymerase III subunit beta n=1 Tax=Acuticoccus sp. I52.16.1 TaxID=2928472 RepID=UPI001FD5D5DC|nr:DNA polymerase III subunit beta [Acuticoccus sp. I52.16.1]UOM33440.1 DNA polymerase III subunit beta [Acuticoccus sp. I52.16.1]